MPPAYPIGQPMPPGSQLHVLEEYSFSDEAAREILKHCEGVMLRYHQKIEEVLAAVQGPGAYGLLPLDKATGPVEKHLHALMSRPELSIVGDIPWQVVMYLAGVQEATMEDIRTLCSHPEAFRQSKKFLAEHPRMAGRQEFSATSLAGASVLAQNDPTRAALVSGLAVRAMEVNGRKLRPFAKEVSDLKGYLNQTSMVIVHANGAERLPHIDARYHALDLTLQNKPGVLWHMLERIRRADIDLTSLHSRPAEDGTYRFYLEMDAAETDADRFRLMVSGLSRDATVERQRWLGSWNVRYNADANGKVPNHTVRERGRLQEPDSYEAQDYQLTVTPRNKLGILGKILGTVHDGGGDLTGLHSQNTGPKEYAFVMNIRREGSSVDFRDMVRVLLRNPDILALEWDTVSETS